MSAEIVMDQERVVMVNSFHTVSKSSLYRIYGHDGRIYYISDRRPLHFSEGELVILRADTLDRWAPDERTNPIYWNWRLVD